MGLFQPVWTGLTDLPGVTIELGEPSMIGMPGVVTVPCLTGVVGETEHRVPGPGVTGACSEYTGRSTGDC